MRKVRPGTVSVRPAHTGAGAAVAILLASGLAAAPARPQPIADAPRTHAIACAPHATPVRRETPPAARTPRHPDGARCAGRHPGPVPRPGPAGGDRERFRILAALLVLVSASGLPPVLNRWRRRRRRVRAMRLIGAEIDSQATRLRIRRLQLLVADAYGTVRTDRWEREKQRFCDSRLRPALARAGLAHLWPTLLQPALRRIERAARRDRTASRGFDPAMHPLDYERFCARLLQQAGWSTRLTPASGDQGADILAERGGSLLVVQCKLYRSAVGNDAVQQVAAARAHQGAQAAIVVSNARFTAAARALARSNRVALLHHEELAGYRPDRSATDRPGSDRPGSDRPGFDRPGFDRPGPDRSGPDQSGPDRSGRDRSGRDQSGDAARRTIASATR